MERDELPVDVTAAFIPDALDDAVAEAKARGIIAEIQSRPKEPTFAIHGNVLIDGVPAYVEIWRDADGKGRLRKVF